MQGSIPLVLCGGLARKVTQSQVIGPHMCGAVESPTAPALHFVLTPISVTIRLVGEKVCAQITGRPSPRRYSNVES